MADFKNDESYEIVVVRHGSSTLGMERQTTALVKSAANVINHSLVLS